MERIWVLILIVMEERIGSLQRREEDNAERTVLILIVMEERIGCKLDYSLRSSSSLNPYCNGRKNRIIDKNDFDVLKSTVLILIVMEERIGFLGGARYCKGTPPGRHVLILIVMEERIGYRKHSLQCIKTTS